MRVRRLIDDEGRRLRRLVRRGEGKGQARTARLQVAMDQAEGRRLTYKPMTGK